MYTHARSNLLLPILVLSSSWQTFADFEPIPLTANSYNQDMVVEQSAPAPVVPVTTASMEQGLANTGFSWFEQGYIPDWPMTGLPPVGSVFTGKQAMDHAYQMADSYRTNNAVLIDSSQRNVLLNFCDPSNYTAVSFLTSSGAGRNLLDYVIHHQDGSTQNGTFTSPYWYDDGEAAWAASGRVDVNSFVHGDLTSYNPRLYGVDIIVTNSLSAIVRIEISLASGSGHTAIFAVSGVSDEASGFTPIMFTGHNVDLVVEASAPQPGFLDTNTTATMDNGTANTHCTWYEQGYYMAEPETGLPSAGSTITNEAGSSHRFTLAPSYSMPNAILMDAVCINCVVTPSQAACYSSLSFLTASGHGPTTNQCIVSYANGTFETNVFVAFDWLSDSPGALAVKGRVSVSTKIVDQVNALGPKLYGADVKLAQTNNPVSSLILSQVTGGGDAHTVVLAVSGIPGHLPDRPTLTAQRGPKGTVILRSSQAGTIESCAALAGPSAIWGRVGTISTTLSLTPTAKGNAFYRVVIP